MGDWTTTRVEDRLESAADVFRTLPGVMPQGFFNAWPEYFHSFADTGAAAANMRALVYLIPLGEFVIR
jgi:hypothetical protein